jgi:hypothetical protein
VSIIDLVCDGRLTAAQGARIYELRRLLTWRKRPWWHRLTVAMLGGRL